jgi:hypothetical protein
MCNRINGVMSKSVPVPVTMSNTLKKQSAPRRAGLQIALGKFSRVSSSVTKGQTG